MTDQLDNPMGLMGFEFIEFASPTPGTLEPIFEIMGFTKVATHRSKERAPVSPGRDQPDPQQRTRQPRFLLRGRAWPVGVRHGVPRQDSQQAYKRALELGAQPIHIDTGPMELNLPAIKGIGGSPLYLIDRFGEGNSIYDIDFVYLEGLIATR